jgi:hypothetical protein
VKANEQVVFRRGRLADVGHEAPPDCGCPATAPPVHTAESAPPSEPKADPPARSAITEKAAEKAAAEKKETTPEPAAAPAAPVATASAIPPEAAASPIAVASVPASAPALPTSEANSNAADGSATAALPPARPNQLHVEVEAPFVFNGDDPVPPPVVVAQVRLTDRPMLPLFEPVVLPPPELKPVEVATASAPIPETKPQKRPFFGRLRSFFAALLK